MTDDTHGSPPVDPEADANYEEAPAATEGETWHGGEPEDDFKDPAHEIPAAENEEGATVFEEEPETQPGGAQDGGESYETAEPEKKRNILLPVMVTVGGILLLGMLAYWQFG